jgi:hypothetical protein
MLYDDQAARWTSLHRPVDSIDAWEGKSGLAGLDLPAPVKGRVLAELRDQAHERYGALDRPFPQEESFELAAVHVPA